MIVKKLPAVPRIRTREALIAWFQEVVDEVKANPEKYPFLADIPLDELEMNSEGVHKNPAAVSEFIDKWQLFLAQEKAGAWARIRELERRSNLKPTKPPFDD